MLPLKIADYHLFYMQLAHDFLNNGHHRATLILKNLYLLLLMHLWSHFFCGLHNKSFSSQNLKDNNPPKLYGRARIAISKSPSLTFWTSELDLPSKIFKFSFG